MDQVHAFQIGGEAPIPGLPPAARNRTAFVSKRSPTNHRLHKNSKMTLRSLNKRFKRVQGMETTRGRIARPRAELKLVTSAPSRGRAALRFPRPAGQTWSALVKGWSTDECHGQRRSTRSRLGQTPVNLQPPWSNPGQPEAAGSSAGQTPVNPQPPWSNAPARSAAAAPLAPEAPKRPRWSKLVKASQSWSTDCKRCACRLRRGRVSAQPPRRQLGDGAEKSFSKKTWCAPGLPLEQRAHRDWLGRTSSLGLGRTFPAPSQHMKRKHPKQKSDERSWRLHEPPCRSSLRLVSIAASTPHA